MISCFRKGQENMYITFTSKKYETPTALCKWEKEFDIPTYCHWQNIVRILFV